MTAPQPQLAGRGRAWAESLAREMYNFLTGIDWSISDSRWKVERMADIIEHAEKKGIDLLRKGE